MPTGTTPNMYNPNMAYETPNPKAANAPQQPQPQMAFFNPQNNLFNDPVASMAVKYGSTLADQGKEFVSQNVDFSL